MLNHDIRENTQKYLNVTFASFTIRGSGIVV